MNATFLQVIENSEPIFSQALSTTEIDWHKESQFAIQALQKNEYLAKTASRSPHTLENAIINLAAIGVSLNPALKHAYLVPRDNQIVLDISYMGLMNLAVKTGSIVFGQSKLVYQNDTYTNNGIDKAPTHEQKTFGDKGEIVGCYCTVKLPSGDYLTEEMDIAELNKIRNASATKAGGKNPWTQWPEEMMRKSVVKRASKYWPVSERLAAATDYLNQTQGNEEQIQNEEKVINQVAELPEYSQEAFDVGYPKWVGLIDEGKQDSTNILRNLQSKYNITEEMINKINNIGGQ